MLSSFRRRGESLRALKTSEVPLGDVDLLEVPFARPLRSVVCAAENAIVNSCRGDLRLGRQESAKASSALRGPLLVTGARVFNIGLNDLLMTTSGRLGYS